MRERCVDCGRVRDDLRDGSCFGCRVKTVRIGFGGYRESFHGDSLVGGTIRSDTKHMVESARANDLDPVPVPSGVSAAPPVSSTLLKALPGS